MLFRSPKGLIDERKRWGAEDISIFADVQVKYAQMITPRPISESVRAAVEHSADGIFISGIKTGVAPSASDLKEARSAASELGQVPVLIGSGLKPANADPVVKNADGAIVGVGIMEQKRLNLTLAKALIKAVRSSTVSWS